jgi:hypothetical protein
MVPDGVTFRLDTSQYLRAALDVLAAHKEGGFHTPVA